MVLTVYVENAFNAVDCIPMFEAFRASAHFLGLTTFVRSFHEHDAHLVYGGAEGHATIYPPTW